MRNITTILFALLLLVSVCQAQNIIYVSSVGSPTGDGKSWGTAYDGSNLQTALNEASQNPGSEVWVAGSGFSTGGSGPLSLSGTVSVYGGFMGHEKSIHERPKIDNDGNDQIEFWEFESDSSFVMKSNGIFSLADGSDIVIDGFGFHNCDHPISGQNFNRLSIRNCLFSVCGSSGSGGALNLENGNVSIEQSQFYNNSCSDDGGAISLNNCTADISYSEFTANYCNNGDGGAIYASHTDLSIVNCLAANNESKSSNGGFLQFYNNEGIERNLSIVNSTIVNNVAGGSGKAINIIDTQTDRTTCNLTNTIIWSDAGESLHLASENFSSTNVTVSYDHCAYWDDQNNGNIDISAMNVFEMSSDQLGTSATNFQTVNWNITEVSGLKDAGSNSIADGLLKKYDIAGNRRTVFSSIDIGVYEFVPEIIEGLSGTNSAVFVAEDFLGNGTGDSWENARGDLAHVLSEAYSGLTILVKAGTYSPLDISDNPSHSFVLPPGVSLLGGFADETNEANRKKFDRNGDNIVQPWEFENETIFTGVKGEHNSLHVVTLGATNYMSSALTSRINGVTVTGGKTDSTHTNKPNGAGVRIVGGSVEQCYIHGNSAENGGGIFATGAFESIIDNSFIENNTANGNGGGIYAQANGIGKNPTIENCLIRNNTTGNSGGGIAGVEATGVDGTKITLTANIIESNTAAVAGGGIFTVSETFQFNRNAIVNNYSQAGSGLFMQQAPNAANSNGHVYITNNLIANNESNAPNGASLLYQNSEDNTNKVWINNNTVVNNKSEGNSGAMLFECNQDGVKNEFITLLNNAIWGNSGTAAIEATGCDTLSISSNAYPTVIQPISATGAGISETLSIDIAESNETGPHFVSPSLIAGNIVTNNYLADYDWSLSPSSPLIEKGTDNMYIGNEDLAGNPRKIFTTQDIGAYEYPEVVGAGNCARSTQSGYMYTPGQGGDAINGGFTLECWVRLMAHKTGANPVLAYHKSDEPLDCFGIFQDGDRFKIYENEVELASTDSIPIGRWCHVGVSLNTTLGTAVFYFNGVAQAEIKNVAFSPASSYDLCMGGRETKKSFDGYLDEVRVWNLPINETDIFANLHQSVTGRNDDLSVYYKFDQADFTYGINCSANGRSASPSGDEAYVFATASTALYSPFIRTLYCPDSGNIIVEWDTIPGASQYNVSLTPEGYPYSIRSYEGIKNSTLLLHEVQGINEKILPETTHEIQVSAKVFGKNSEQRRMNITTPLEAPGKAVSLDGVDDNIKLPDHIEFGNTFTLSTWVKLKEAGRGQNLATFHSDNQEFLNFMVNGPADNLVFVYNDDIDTKNAETAFSLPLGKWSHISYTYDGSNLKIYVNGELVNNTELTFSLEGVSFSTNYIGSTPLTGYANIDLDEFSIYNRALSHTEIQLQMHQPIQQEDSLQLYYSFDNAEGDLVVDRTGKTGDGILMPTGNDRVSSLAMLTPFTKSVSNLSENGFDLEYYGSYKLESDYTVTVSANSDYSNHAFQVSTGETSVTVTDLLPGTKYYYYIEHTYGTDLIRYEDSVSTPFAPPGNAVSLDGGSNYITYPSRNLFTNNFTVSAWVNLKGSGSQSRLARYIKNSELITFGLSNIETQYVYFIYNDGLGTAESLNKISSEYILSPDQWYKIDYTFDSQFLKIYANGKLVAEQETALPGIGTIDFSQALMGMSTTELLIDEFAIYNHALTIDEIKLQMCKPAEQSNTDLELYYSFDAPEGDLITDRTGKTGNATLLPADDARVPSDAMRIPIVDTLLNITPYGFDVEWFPTYNYSGIYTVTVSKDLNFDNYIVRKTVDTTVAPFAGLQPDTKYYFQIESSLEGNSYLYVDSVVTKKSNPQLYIADNVLAFGGVLTTDESTSKYITLTNTGNDSLILTSFSGLESPYTLNAWLDTLLPSEELEFEIVINPDYNTGSYIDTLIIKSNTGKVDSVFVSGTINLTPMVISQPDSIGVCEGSLAEIGLSTTTFAKNFFWQKWDLIERKWQGIGEGAGSDTLRFAEVTIENEGWYRLQVFDINLNYEYSDSVGLFVFQNPDVSFPLDLQTDICWSSAPINVTPAENNSLNGTGQFLIGPADGMFTPTANNVGDNNLEYVFESDAGCTDTATAIITVSKPEAPIVDDETIHIGDPVPVFVSSIVENTVWLNHSEAIVGTDKDFNPIVETTKDSIYNYSAYHVDANDCSSDTVSFILEVTSCTVPKPIATNDSVCQGTDIPSLSASSEIVDATFIWYLSTSKDSVLAETADYTPTQAGTYYVSQTVECESPLKAVSLGYYPQPEIASISYKEVYYNVKDSAYELTSVPSGVFSGDYIVDNAFNPSQLPVGAYEVTLTVTENGCSVDSVFNLDVDTVRVSIVGLQSKYCVDSDDISFGVEPNDIGIQGYFYGFGIQDDGVLGTESTYSPSKSGVRTETVWFQYEDRGQTFVASHQIEVVETISVSLGNDIVTSEAAITLKTDKAFSAYKWSTDEQSETITVQESGTYYVAVNDGYCSASDTINVKFETVCDIPAPVLETDSIGICLGTDTAFYVVSVQTYETVWYLKGGDIAVAAGDAYPVYETTPGMYYYDVTHQSQLCESEPTTVTAVLFPSPKVYLAPEYEIVSGESATVVAFTNNPLADRYIYNWSADDNLVNGSTTPQVKTGTLADDIILTLTVEDTLSKCSIEKSTQISVYEEFVPVSAIELPTNIGIVKGETKMLVAQVFPENASNKTITWATSDESIVSIDQQGTVTALTEGMATIMASNANETISAASLVTVTGTVVELADVYLPDTVKVPFTAGTYQFTATAIPYNATVMNIEWASLSTSIATINPETGFATFINAGTVEITAIDQSQVSAKSVLMIMPSQAPEQLRSLPAVTITNEMDVVKLNLALYVTDDNTELKDLAVSIMGNNTITAQITDLALLELGNLTSLSNTTDINIALSDVDGNLTKLPISITVSDKEDEAPEMNNITDQLTKPGEEFTSIDLLDKAQDDYTLPENLEFTVTAPETVTAIISDDKQLKITPNSDNWTGPDTVVVTVTDGNSTTTYTEIVYSESSAENKAPEIFPIPDQICDSIFDFHTIFLNQYVSDDYTAIEDIVWTASTSSKLNITIVDSKVSIRIADASWMGTEAITLYATDEQGATSSYTVEFSQQRKPEVDIQGQFVFDFKAPKRTAARNAEVDLYADIKGVDYWKWIIEGLDPSQENELNPIVSFAEPGTYDVSLVVTDGVEYDTLTKANYINIVGLTQADTVLCKGDSLFLEANKDNFTAYEWSNGTRGINTYAKPEESVEFGLTITDVFFKYADYISVEIAQPVALGADTALCSKDTLMLAIQGYETYAWNTGEFNDTIYLATADDFALTVTDVYGCVTADSITITDIYTLPDANLGMDMEACHGVTVNLDAGSFASYTWNTGETTQRIKVKETNDYVVKVADDNGCVNTDTATVTFQQPYPEQISLATYSNDGSSIVVAWERTPDVYTESYTLMRESGGAGQYMQLVQRAYEDSLYYVDTDVNADQQTYRYKLVTTDVDCGNTADSDPHRTIHLTKSVGTDGINLEFTDYQGLEVDLYNIYRFRNNELIKIGEVIPDGSNTYSYTDFDFQNGDMYRVGFDLGKTVVLSSLKTDSGPFSQSMSNLSEAIIVNGADDIKNASRLYPNPAKDIVTIELPLNTISIDVISTSGIVVKTIQPVSNIVTLDISEYTNGVYTISINSANGTEKLLLVKE